MMYPRPIPAQTAPARGSPRRAVAAVITAAAGTPTPSPLSVDGVEIVASLVLLADRRAGRRSRWLPWAALTIGTAASLAANIATADTGAISRIIAGWPALALLIAVKVLSGILEHRRAAGRPAATVPDPAADAARDGPCDQARPLPRQPVVPVPSAPRRDARRPPARNSTASKPAPAGITLRHASSPHSAGARPAHLGTVRAAPEPGTVPAIPSLLPAARAARDELERDGYPLTRDALAAHLRQAGHPVRSSRLTLLLHALRAEPAGLSRTRGLLATRTDT